MYAEIIFYANTGVSKNMLSHSLNLLHHNKMNETEITFIITVYMLLPFDLPHNKIMNETETLIVLFSYTE